MVNLAIAMTTAPRPIETVQKSLASLRAAGFGQHVLVSFDGPDHDGPDVSADPDWTVCTYGARVGVPRHWLRTLETLLYTTSEPWLLMLQDDTTWQTGAAAALEARRKALAPFWSLYVDKTVATHLEASHGRPLAPGAYYSRLGHQSGGALAYGFWRPFAERLVGDPGFREDVETHERGIDRWVPKAALSLGHALQVWVPSLVTHTLGSGNSSMRPKAPRDTPYPGAGIVA